MKKVSQQHGYWKFINYNKRTGDSDWRCSSCGYILSEYSIYKRKICPFCGAIMDGDGINDDSCLTFKDYQKSIETFIKSESNEIVTSIQKYLFKDRKISNEEIIKKLGNALLYIAAIAQIQNINFEKIAVESLKKIKIKF